MVPLPSTGTANWTHRGPLPTRDRATGRRRLPGHENRLDSGGYPSPHNRDEYPTHATDKREPRGRTKMAGCTNAQQQTPSDWVAASSARFEAMWERFWAQLESTHKPSRSSLVQSTYGKEISRGCTP
ncbi:Hypothetical predicted protein [Pelobates cultripes]|nr:Hypothetical predicted protein [Pelobates cultripes]